MSFLKNEYHISLLFIAFLFLGCENKEKMNSQYKSSIINKVIYSNDNKSLLYKGYTYYILRVNDKEWLDRNLGASKECANYKGDLNCWGDLYQWGRLADGHQKRTSLTRKKISNSSQPNHNNFIVSEDKSIIPNANWYTINDNSLWKQNGENSVCPAGWHVPTIQEFKTLNIDNSFDAYEKLKLSESGQRVGISKYDIGGKIMHANMGCYWTSETEREYAIAFEINSFDKKYSGLSGQVHTPKIMGCAVRCSRNKL